MNFSKKVSFGQNIIETNKYFPKVGIFLYIYIKIYFVAFTKYSSFNEFCGGLFKQITRNASSLIRVMDSKINRAHYTSRTGKLIHSATCIASHGVHIYWAGIPIYKFSIYSGKMQ